MFSTTVQKFDSLWRSHKSRPGSMSASKQAPSPRRQREEPLSIQQVQVEEILEDDAIIAIMGPTGAGKSSFINVALQQTANHIGHTLTSCTANIQATACHYPYDGGRKIIFVDTPGFDDTEKSDMEVLEMIADWLNRTYERNVKLAGILYLHRISDNRMVGTPLKNLNMFAKLCGEKALQNVILVTTVWDEVYEEIGSSREKELQRQYWRDMMAMGSKTIRFEDTFSSAWDIVDLVTAEVADRHALLLQREMVDLSRQLAETKAGVALHSQLQKLLADQRDTLNKLRTAARDQSDDIVKEALQEEYDEIKKKLEATFQDVEALKIPLGKRLRRSIVSPWKFLGKSSKRRSALPPSRPPQVASPDVHTRDAETPRVAESAHGSQPQTRLKSEAGHLPSTDPEAPQDSSSQPRLVQDATHHLPPSNTLSVPRQSPTDPTEDYKLAARYLGESTPESTPAAHPTPVTVQVAPYSPRLGNVPQPSDVVPSVAERSSAYRPSLPLQPTAPQPTMPQPTMPQPTMPHAPPQPEVSYASTITVSIPAHTRSSSVCSDQVVEQLDFPSEAPRTQYEKGTQPESPIDPPVNHPLYSLQRNSSGERLRSSSGKLFPFLFRQRK